MFHSIWYALWTVIFVAGCSPGQTVRQMLDTATGMPADIDTTTLSRLPEITRSDLDEDGQRIYDLVIGPDRTTPVIGPAAISFHSPRVAEAMHLLNQYLRYESVLGRRFTEVAILVAARELDQQFEWTRHEAAAREEGVSQAVIDTIKFDRPVRNLSREETLIINYGRQIFRQHRLSSGLFAEAVALFGTQGAFELAAIMGDYAMAGIMLHAVDQQLPVDEAPLLPVVE